MRRAAGCLGRPPSAEKLRAAPRRSAGPGAAPRGRAPQRSPCPGLGPEEQRGVSAGFPPPGLRQYALPVWPLQTQAPKPGLNRYFHPVLRHAKGGKQYI